MENRNSTKTNNLHHHRLKADKTVHVNRLRIQNQPTFDSIATPEEHTWEAPSIEHEVIDTEIPRERRYPTRNRRPPDRLTF